MGNSGSSASTHVVVVEGHVLRLRQPLGEPSVTRGSSGGSGGGAATTTTTFLAEDDARRKFTVQVTRVPKDDARANAQAARELKEHARLPPHPHLLAYVASKIDGGSEGGHTLYYLVTEHCPRTVRGVMEGAAKRREPLHEREVLNVFTSAAAAVAHLHAHGVAHRDVRVETLQFGAVDGHVKLGGLGSCSTEHRRIRGGTEAGAVREEMERATTPACRAPEQVDLFSGKVVGEKVDIWALGVLLYQLCWWRTPFEDAGSPHGVSTMAILNARYKAPFVSSGLPPYSPGITALLKELLEPDPDRRPAAHQVLLRVRELMRENEIGYFTDLPALGGGGNSSAGGSGAASPTADDDDLLGIHSLSVNPPAPPPAGGAVGGGGGGGGALAALPTTRQPSPILAAHVPLALSLSLSASASASRSAAAGGGGGAGRGGGRVAMPPPIVITPGKGHKGGNSGVMDLSASASASLAGAGSTSGHKPPQPQQPPPAPGMGRKSLSFARLVGLADGAQQAVPEGEDEEDWRDEGGLDWTMGAGDLAVSASSTRRRGSSGATTVTSLGVSGGTGPRISDLDLSEMATVNRGIPRSSSASSLSGLYDEVTGRVKNPKTALGLLWQRRMRSFMGGSGGAGWGEKGKRSWVVKATSREPGQPKAKYVRKIVLAVWERQMSSSTFFIHLYQRPVLSHPVVALKGLITTLKLLQQGPRDFLRECHPCVTFLDDIGRHWGAILGKVATEPTHEQLTRSCTAEGYTSVVPYLLPASGVAGGAAPTIGSSSPSHKRQHLDAASMDLMARLARLLVAKLNFHEHHPAFATHFTAIPAMLGYDTVPVAGGEEDFKALSRLLTLQDAILHTGRLAFAAKNEGVAATARWLLLPLVEEAYTVLVACTFLLASLLELSARAAAGLPLPPPATAAAPASAGTTSGQKRSSASSNGAGVAAGNGAGASGPVVVVEWRQRVTALLALREQYEDQLAQLRQLYADAERVEEVRAMKRVPLLPASVPVALDGALNWKPSTMRSPLQGFLDRARMEEEQGAALALGLALDDETPRTRGAPAPGKAGGAGGMPITKHALAELEDGDGAGDLPISSSSGHGGSAGLAFAPVPAPPASSNSSSALSTPVALAPLPPLPGPALLPLATTAAATAASTALSMATWESFADTAGFSNQQAAAAAGGSGGSGLAASPIGTGSGSPTFFSTRTPLQHSQLQQLQQRLATARPSSSLAGASVSGTPPPPTTPALGPASVPGAMASSSSPQPLLASTTAQQQQQQQQLPAPPAGAEGKGEWFLPSSVQAAAARLESVSGLASGPGAALASSAGQPLLGATPAAVATTPGRAACAGSSSRVEDFLQTTAQLDGSLVLPVISPTRGPHHHHHHHPAPSSLPPRMSIAGVPVGGAEGQAMLAKGDSRDLLEWSSSSDEEEDEDDDLTGTSGSVAALNTENMSRIIGVGAGMGGSAVIMGALGTVDGEGSSSEAKDGDESKRAPEDQRQQAQQPVQAEAGPQQPQQQAVQPQQPHPLEQQQEQPPPAPAPPAPVVTPAQQQAQQAVQEKQARARRREARAQPWRAHLKPAVATALTTCLREFEAHASTLVPLDDIVWGETIGHGAFATVYRAYCRGHDVAVKKLVTQNNLPMAEKSVRDFASEVSLLRVLHHPNVIAFVGACADPVAVLTEYCHKGNLFMVLNEKARYKDISWARKLSVARGLADGMHYLHTRDPILIHRDLKSLNVLLTRDWVVKITDFGLSRFKPHSLSDIMTMQCGTYHWMAPEVINSTKYTEKADVYSFAIILWEIYTRAIPYDGMQPVQVVAAVINRGERPPLPADCPAEYATLVRACWAHDAAERPSFSEIVEWLRSIPT